MKITLQVVSINQSTERNVLCKPYGFDPLGLDVSSLATDCYSILFVFLSEYKSKTKVLSTLPATHSICLTSVLSTLCLKKTTLMLHTIPSTNINLFWYFWQRCCWESTLSNGDLLSQLSQLMSLHYLRKHKPRKLCLFSHACYILDTHQPLLIIFCRQ